MLKLSHDLRFLDETRNHAAAILKFAPQHLDGHVATQVWIPPFEDDAHSAAGDLADQLIPSDGIDMHRRGRPTGYRDRRGLARHVAQEHTRLGSEMDTKRPSKITT